MAIAVGNIRNFTPSANASSPQTITGYAPSGRTLVVVITIYDTSATDGVVSSVTHAGQNLTQGTLTYDATSDGHISIWYLLEAPTTYDDIVVTFGGTVTDFMGTAFSIRSDSPLYVDSTGTPATGNGDPSITWSTNATDTIAIAGMLDDQSVGSKVTSDNTELYTQDVGSDTVGAAYAIRTSSGSQTLSWTDTDADEDYVVAGMAFAESSVPTVTLNNPADAGSTNDSTPILYFTGTDSESDNVDYQLQLDDSNLYYGENGGTIDSVGITHFGDYNVPVAPGAVGNSFVGDGTAVNKVRFRIKRAATLGDYAGIQAVLYAHTGTPGTNGTPTGSPLSVSNIIPASDIGTSYDYYWFDFLEPYTTTNSTRYFITLHYYGDTAADVTVSYSAQNNGGNIAYKAAAGWGTWSPGTYELLMLVGNQDTLVDWKSEEQLAGFHNNDTPADTQPFNSGDEIKAHPFWTVMDSSWTGTVEVGLDDYPRYVAQSFTGDGNDIGGITMRLWATGTTTGPLSAKIYTHSGTYGTSSIPDTVRGGTLDIDASEVPVGSANAVDVPFPFSNAVSTVNGTKYCVYLTNNNYGDASNYVSTLRSSSSVHGGNYSEFDTSWTAYSAYDLNFKVHRVLPEGTWYWKVRAKDNKTGVYGPWSERSFTIDLGTTPAPTTPEPTTQGPTTVPPTTIAPTTVGLNALGPVASAQNITVVPGEATAALDAVDSPVVAENLTVVPGETTISLNALSVQTTAATLASVYITSTIPLNALDIPASALPLDVAPGEATITLDGFNIIINAASLDVVPVTNIQLNGLEIPVTAADLTVVAGEATISLNAVNVGVTAPNLTVSKGEVTIPLDALVVSVTAETLNVTNSQTIALDALNIVSTAGSLTISVGEVTIPLNALDVPTNAENLTVVSVVSILLDALGIVVNPADVTLQLGGVTISLDALQSQITVSNLTVIPGETTIQLNALDIPVTAETLDVVPVTTVSLSALDVSTTAASLTVVPGEETILLDALDIPTNAPNLTVVPGSETIQLNAIDVPITAANIDVSSAEIIQLDALSVVPTAASLIVVTGATSVQLNALQVSTTAVNLTVVPGVVSILLDALEIATAAANLTVSAPPPTTTEPTTSAPTTVAPTTAAPTTPAPTTLAPTTLPSTTLAPSTAPGSTSAPTTSAPTSTPPTTAWPYITCYHVLDSKIVDDTAKISIIKDNVDEDSKIITDVTLNSPIC